MDGNNVWICIWTQRVGFLKLQFDKTEISQIIVHGNFQYYSKIICLQSSYPRNYIAGLIYIYYTGAPSNSK